eukprot:scaffold84154_cov69-Phaeocystis_antarctica.AAC.3
MPARDGVPACEAGALRAGACAEEGGGTAVRVDLPSSTRREVLTASRYSRWTIYFRLQCTLWGVIRDVNVAMRDRRSGSASLVLGLGRAGRRGGATRARGSSLGRAVGAGEHLRRVVVGGGAVVERRALHQPPRRRLRAVAPERSRGHAMLWRGPSTHARALASEHAHTLRRCCRPLRCTQGTYVSARRGDGGRAAVRRPPPEAAARWRPVGCQHRVRYTLMCQYSHSCTYCGCTHCGCTVPGVVSQRPPASILLSSGRMSSGRSANSSACRSSDECAIAGGGLWWVSRPRQRYTPRTRRKLVPTRRENFAGLQIRGGKHRCRRKSYRKTGEACLPAYPVALVPQ